MDLLSFLNYYSPMRRVHSRCWQYEPRKNIF